MHKNKSLGIYGENLAIEFLENKGYKILAKNYRCKIGEIDIIAADGDTLSFIEVKTRSSNQYGRPCEAVNYNKQIKIVKTALHYINRNNLTQWMSRFDIVEILIETDDRINSINLIQNAFEYNGSLGY
ncbi:MAG: YraN family protein [Firmicutes bacterium]|nr:YraN family protein [Bacillota bacterium]